VRRKAGTAPAGLLPQRRPTLAHSGGAAVAFEIVTAKQSGAISPRMAEKALCMWVVGRGGHQVHENGACSASGARAAPYRLPSFHIVQRLSRADRPNALVPS